MFDVNKHRGVPKILGKKCQIEGYEGPFKISGVGTLKVEGVYLAVEIPEARVLDINEEKLSVKKYTAKGVDEITSSYEYDGRVHISFSHTNITLAFEPLQEG